MHGKSEAIQFLRGVAILLVLIVHWGLGTFTFQWLGLTNPGWIGVELFFVISGFVVIRSFERTAFDVGRFVNSRIFRLYPALVLLLAVALAANVVLPYVTPPEGLRYFWTSEKLLIGQTVAILFGFHPSTSFGQSYTNGVLWSLSKEFQFYAALAFLAFVFKLLVRGRLTVRRGIFYVALIVYSGGTLSRTLIYFGYETAVGNILTAGKFDLMALGVLGGMLPLPLLRSIASRVRPVTPLLLGMPLVALSFSRGPNSPTGAGDLLESLLMILVGLSFVLLVIVADEDGAWKFLGPLSRFMVWLGDRSYTVFLFHFLCMMCSYYVAIYIFMPPLGDWSWAVMECVTSILILLPVVEGTYRFVEQPMIEFGKRRLRERRSRAVETMAAVGALAPND
jgi:peptidoglycan/LPS O-acetylase OafA/YrhL